jgi:hypothetical protein
MKIISLTVAIAILSLIHPVQILAKQGNEANWLVSQNVNIRTDANNEQVQYSSVSLYRTDLREPHILRVRGELNNSPIPMEQVVVKLNGKVVKSIAGSDLELNLAPMMIPGRNEVEVSGTTVQSGSTISLNFKGPRTQVNQQSSGSGRIKQMLTINVF